jgi:pimeloyl-ACP methyl ester carboxylesterase
MRSRILLCMVFVFSALFAYADTLPRQAYLGVSLRMSKSGTGAEVTKVQSPEVASKLGLRTGDHILEIDNIPLTSARVLHQVMRKLHGGKRAHFKITRESHVLELAGILEPLPSEKLPGVEIIHDSVLTSEGYRLRSIITRPQNKPGKLPVIFLVGWLSCDSVEYPLGPDDGFGQLLYDLATQSGMVLFRVDKPGTGDSEGPACSDLDLTTELASYKAAFKAMHAYDFIDPDRVFVLGMSNGAGFAPLVTHGTTVKGFIVVGGWVKTWFEHMLELERRRVQLSGMRLDKVAGAMRGYAEFYDDYLIKKQTPGEIIKAKPGFASLWYDQPDHQYGRPASFFQQMEQLDLLGAWSKVDTPVLALHGQYDWIMSREDHEIIAALANKKHPGAGTFLELSKTNHLLYEFDTPEEAFRNVPSGHYNPEATTAILNFLRHHQ